MFLRFDTISNIRDLGGIVNREGEKVRSGRLYRSAALDALSDAERERLAGEYGLRAVVDFRGIREAELNPDRIADPIRYFRFSALPSLDNWDEDDGFLPGTSVVDYYCGSYREMAEDASSHLAFRGFFDVLLETEGAVLWHCYAGKDRTGVAAALLLSALDVAPEEIREDYFLTNFPGARRYIEITAGVENDADKEYIRALCFVQEEFLQTFYETVERLFGGVKNFLHDAVGIKEEEIAELRRKYLE